MFKWVADMIPNGPRVPIMHTPWFRGTKYTLEKVI